MTETTLVASVLLYEDKNEPLYKYFNEIAPLFAFLVRRTIHHMRNGLNGENKSEYRTRLKHEYQLTNRFAKAIMTTAQNLLKLSTTSGEYLHSTYSTRIKNIDDKIIKTKRVLNNPKTTRQRMKQQRAQLYRLQMKKNKLKQLQNNGVKPMLTFGTKELLKRNKDLFLKKRDNQIVYIGDKNEHLGNQQVKLFYDKKYNKFTYKLRVENTYIQDSKYIYGEFIIKDKFAKRKIIKTLNTPKSKPLSFRVIKQDERLYLQIMYKTGSDPKTRNSNGVLGVDFNKGFVTISEIDQNGILLHTGRINYIHRGTSGVTRNSMLHLVKELVDSAINSGKDIVIEDLKSLNKTKIEKTERKHYNRMINRLKFGQFREFLETRCDKFGVGLSLVNPYNTSKIAADKYCYNMKLNVHSGASYVIARRFYNLD